RAARHRRRDPPVHRGHPHRAAADHPRVPRRPPPRRPVRHPGRARRPARPARHRRRPPGLRRLAQPSHRPLPRGSARRGRRPAPRLAPRHPRRPGLARRAPGHRPRHPPPAPPRPPTRPPPPGPPAPRPPAPEQLRFDGPPTTSYTRPRDDAVTAVAAVLAATANPQNPNEVTVSRPSDALAAKHAADTTLTALLLGLGAVALLVGGVGVANTMVISVLERRPEIGLRPPLGAPRGHIGTQFLADSLLLSALGGLGGALLGIAVTTGYAPPQHWPAVVPLWATTGGLLATLLIGATAGLYPAWR